MCLGTSNQFIMKINIPIVNFTNLRDLQAVKVATTANYFGAIINDLIVLDFKFLDFTVQPELTIRDYFLQIHRGSRYPNTNCSDTETPLQ